MEFVDTEYWCKLDNDIMVQPGALEAQVQMLDIEPDLRVVSGITFRHGQPPHYFDARLNCMLQSLSAETRIQNTYTDYGSGIHVKIKRILIRLKKGNYYRLFLSLVQNLNLNWIGKYYFC